MIRLWSAVRLLCLIALLASLCGCGSSGLQQANERHDYVTHVSILNGSKLIVEYNSDTIEDNTWYSTPGASGLLVFKGDKPWRDVMPPSALEVYARKPGEHMVLVGVRYDSSRRAMTGSNSLQLDTIRTYHVFFEDTLDLASFLTHEVAASATSIETPKSHLEPFRVMAGSRCVAILKPSKQRSEQWSSQLLHADETYINLENICEYALPCSRISFHVETPVARIVNITVSDTNGKLIRTVAHDCKAGINEFEIAFDDLPSGEYLIADQRFEKWHQPFRFSFRLH